ncbi:MAG: serine aminopeptidase domain-containing protein [Steroidobacteraceae bacterium]
MRSILRAAGQSALAPTRMVWLPGAYHSPEDFLAAGFDAQVRMRGLPLDLVFVDTEPLHLGDRSALERLQRDIVAPARALGCRSVWLAGISLGGFIALDYAATHPGQWDGLCLLAPYLGNRMLIAEIAAAPGLAAWEPGPLAESDEERRIWRFIQTQRAQSPPIHLGYGRADRFAPAHGLMAQALPPDAVDVVPGGHDWHTWSILWGQFLDSYFK